MLQARGKTGIAGVGGNRVTVMARERRSSLVLLGANRIIRHVRSGVRGRDPAALLILRQLALKDIAHLFRRPRGGRHI